MKPYQITILAAFTISTVCASAAYSQVTNTTSILITNSVKVVPVPSAVTGNTVVVNSPVVVNVNTSTTGPVSANIRGGTESTVNVTSGGTGGSSNVKDVVKIQHVKDELARQQVAAQTSRVSITTAHATDQSIEDKRINVEGVTPATSLEVVHGGIVTLGSKK